MVSSHHPVDTGVGFFVGCAFAGEGQKKEEGLAPVTEPEIRRLMLHIVWPHLMDAEKALVWSYWRRRHQAMARNYHYKKRKSCKLQL
jgi:hypothetical protein